MSSKNLNNFLKALKAVSQDYTCPVCLELCNNPVTLSKCFHMICHEHFDNLKTCPKCDVSLEGCTFYKEERLNASVEATRKLDKIFESFKTTQTHSKTEKSDEPKKKRAGTKPEIGDDKGIATKTGKKPALRSNNTNISATSDQNPKRQAKELVAAGPSTLNKVTNKSLEATPLRKSSVDKDTKSLEKRNNKGETALHIACRLGKADKVMELLSLGANTNTKDHAGWTPLHEVVQNGRLDLVKLLLHYNILINVPGPSNETPLHEAVRYNHKDIAEELVKNGADLEIRNCKGETPLHLASEEMKAILESAKENIIQTQTLNVTRLSELYTELDSDDIRVYCISQLRTVLNKLKLLAKIHKNIHIEAKLTDKVTHLIVDTEDDGTCMSSLDILQGIVKSMWILTTQWVMESTEKQLAPFEDYEVKGIGTLSYTGQKNSRFNKYKQLPGLFNGCHFYLHNFNTKFEVSKNIVLTKAILTKLITDAGGIVLRRVPNPELIPDSEKLVPYHAKKNGKLAICSHYIIFKNMYEPMYNMQHLKALPVGWLIECIERYELVEHW